MVIENGKVMPMNIHYSIQGLRNGEWVTLFSPFATSRAARLRLCELAKANPACRYRLRWHGDSKPIIETDREQRIADDLLAQAQARRDAREATRDPVTKRLP